MAGLAARGLKEDRIWHLTQRVMKVLKGGPGIPLVQFRTVQLSDGKLQLQRRKACLVIKDDASFMTVCRLHENGRELASPIVVHTTMRIGQIQRVLHQIETTTLQKAVTEPPGPNEKDSRPVNGDECFSLIYGNQYVDFEILPSSTVPAADLRQWLVLQATYLSLISPQPVAKSKSSFAAMIPRGARGTKEARAHAAANSGAADEDAVVRMEENGGTEDSFAGAMEMGRDLPIETVMPQLTALDSSALSPAIQTGAGFGAFVVGALTCHGCEPNPYSRTDVVGAKTNQDCGCVVWPLATNENMAFVAVFDGHGELGHKVSNFCMRRIAESVTKGMSGYQPVSNASEKVANSVPGETLTSAFEGANELLKETHLDWGNGGGTTAVALIMVGEKCTIANCGDSRIVVGTRPRPGAPLRAKDLSIDHTPTLPAERARVEAAGGYVAQDDDETEARVWLDRGMSCGLAMSRSLGDLHFKSKGVIATPELTTHTITSGNEFLIACSDGVWGVMSSQEAVDIVASNIERQPDKRLNAFLAAQEVLTESARRWKDDEGDYRDDITAVVVALPCVARQPKATQSGSPRSSRSPRISKSPKNPPRSSPRSQWNRSKSPGSKTVSPSKPKRRGLTRMVSVKEADLTAPKGLKM